MIFSIGEGLKLLGDDQKRRNSFVGSVLWNRLLECLLTSNFTTKLSQSGCGITSSGVEWCLHSAHADMALFSLKRSVIKGENFALLLERRFNFKVDYRKLVLGSV